MPNKEDSKKAERAIEAHAHQPPPCDTDDVLRTLNQVFSSFRNRLEQEAPPPFDGNAKVAVDVFNDIVAGLELKFVPASLTVTGSAISSTVIELTWVNATNNADGFKIQRCEGAYCDDFVEIRQLPATERSYRDANLTPQTTYRYMVVAFNARGEASSNIVNVTTNAA